MDKKDFLDQQQKYGTLMSLGFQLAAGIIFFVFLGQFIDKKIGNEGTFFTVLGMCLGFAYSVYEVIKLIKKLNDK